MISMKKEVIVNWSPVEHNGDASKSMNGAHILFEEPQSLLKEVGKEFKNFDFWKCPAVIDLCTNTYLIRAPFDITVHLTHNANGSYSFVAPTNGQAVIDAFFHIRRDGTMSLPPQYIFYCDEPLMMEVFPTPFLTAPLNNMALIAGSYDVGRWLRPIEFAFRPIDINNPIEIKRGMPLFCVRFLTKSDEAVRLVRVPMSDDLSKMMDACVGVKHLSQKIPLKRLYKLAEPLLSFRKKKKI